MASKEINMAAANQYCIFLCFLCVVIVMVSCITHRQPRYTHQLRVFGVGNLRLKGYVIHLANRTDRDDNLRKLLSNADAGGVALTVVDAVDGRPCHARKVQPFMDYTRPPGKWRDHLRGGEQGCLASYLKVFEMCRESQDNQGCFFVEDDAIVPKQTFKDMSVLLHTFQDRALLMHGRRAYPTGWTDRAAIASEEHTAGDYIPGWQTIELPNYSTAFFALTARGVTALSQWLQTLISKNLHQLPADDLLSFACGAHPTVYLAPASQRWAGVSPVLTGLAPIRPLANRMQSPSDTERYVPSRNSSQVHCDILPTPKDA